jgi:hypothetical protein
VTALGPARAVIRRIAGTEPGRVRRVAELNVVIKDDTVLVVDDLGFVARLDMLAEPTFADRSSV